MARNQTFVSGNFASTAGPSATLCRQPGSLPSKSFRASHHLPSLPKVRAGEFLMTSLAKWTSAFSTERKLYHHNTVPERRPTAGLATIFARGFGAVVAGMVVA
jgi:hypothetical protein